MLVLYIDGVRELTEDLSVDLGEGRRLCREEGTVEDVVVERLTVWRRLTLPVDIS